MKRYRHRMASHAFRLAVEARDLDAMRELLADNVVFNSPAAHKPFEGRQVVAQVLALPPRHSRTSATSTR